MRNGRVGKSGATSPAAGSVRLGVLVFALLLPALLACSKGGHQNHTESSPAESSKAHAAPAGGSGERDDGAAANPVGGTSGNTSGSASGGMSGNTAGNASGSAEGTNAGTTAGNAAGNTAGNRPGSTADNTPPDMSSNILTATVRDILGSPAAVGKTVYVSGRCLGHGQTIAQGPPPLTRSDWQLEDDGVAIYVSGPLPEGCSPTAGSASRTTLRARVEQDSIPGLGGRQRHARRYLVRLDR